MFVHLKAVLRNLILPPAGLVLLGYGAYVARRTSLPVLISGSADEAEAMRVTLSRDFGITARWGLRAHRRAGARAVRAVAPAQTAALGLMRGRRIVK